MSYIKTEWQAGDLISKERLNHIEDGIADADVAKLSPVSKTSAMTQAVGKDENGKLWTAPSGGSESTIAWIPTVDAAGNISWERSSSETIPRTRNIRGPRGFQGDPGAAGNDGASAYEQAISGGYTGTESQFNSDLAAVSSKASTVTITASTSASGWVQQLNGYYAQSVAASGITPDDNPIADVVLGYDPAADKAYLIAWSKIMTIIAGNGSVTLFASEEPQSGFTFQLKVVR